MNPSPADLFRMSCGATAPLELIIFGSSGSEGERRVFEHPFALIGRHQRSCIRFEDAAVSRRHAYLQQLGEKVFCIDLGSRTGIRREDKPCPACWLSPDYGIDIGPFTLELPGSARIGGFPGEAVWDDSDPLQDRVDDPRPLPRITVEMGNKVLSRFRMNRQLALVGSAPDCRVRLRHAAVSRYHCSFVKTTEGVWVIDLLSSTGTRLNGDVVRWTLVKEGDRLQVGPYVLRVKYRVSGRLSAPVRLSSPSLSSEDSPFSSGGPMPSGIVRVQSLTVSRPETYWTAMPDPENALEMDLDGERKRQAEVFLRQLADSHAECDRLREQTRELEIQVAELSVLQSRLEAAEANAHELEIIRAERDLWKNETQDIQARIAADLAERNELRQRLDQAQQQLAEQREANRALGFRLEEQSTSLQEVRADLAARSAELAVTLQRLHEMQEQLARSQDESRGLLDQTQAGQRHTEELRQQLADAQGQCDQLGARLRDADAEKEQLRIQLRTAETQGTALEALRVEGERLREQVRAQEVQLAEMAALQSRLEAAEGATRELEIVRTERDRWQRETEELENRIASDFTEREQFDRLAADLHAAQRERDRLHTEQQASRHSADQAWARVSDLERALKEAATAHERAAAEVCARWEKERQARDTESDRLRQQLRVVESQAAELPSLRASLKAAEASARQLQAVCSERDRLQNEAEILQNRIAANKVEQKDLRQRLKTAQQELAVEREAARTASERLDQESAVLQEVRADLAVRNTEFDTVLQRLHLTQEELARSQNEARNLQGKVDQAQEYQRDAETRMQQLAEAQTKLDQSTAQVFELEGQISAANRLLERLGSADVEAERLRQQLQAAESQVAELASLRADLDVAQTKAQQLEIVRAERDRWQNKVQEFQTRIETDLVNREQLDRLAADLCAVREERDRLHTEHQSSQQSAEQAKARVIDLERTLKDEAAAHERTVAERETRWEQERQALETRLEGERQTLEGATQAAVRDAQARAEATIRDVQTRAASEQDDLQQRLKATEAQIVRERGVFQEQTEQLREQVAILQQERDTLAARLSQVELAHQAAQARSQEIDTESAPIGNVATVEQEQLASLQDLPACVAKQESEVGPKAEAIMEVERRSPSGTQQEGQAEPGESSRRSETPRVATAPVAGEQLGDNIHDWLLQRKGQEPLGFWQRILNFMAGR